MGLGTHWGNIRIVLGFYVDNGNENGNYYLAFRFQGVGKQGEAFLTLLTSMSRVV